jgi:hypothetical protein
MHLHWNRAFLLIAVMVAFSLTGSSAHGQLLIPEVSIDVSSIPDEAKTKLAGLDSLLINYLNHEEWTRDEYQYDFPIQINIFVTEYSPNPLEDKYKARLIATNKQDLRLEDTRWEFGLKQPIIFRQNEFHAFTSVVNFWVWVLIGTEYDRLEKYGGTPYYEKAKQIYLQSSSSPYFFGWDRRIDQLRNMTDDNAKPARELNFFYYTGMYYDEEGNFSSAKDYLYYALVKLDKVPIDVQRHFLETNYLQFAQALVRAGYPKGVRVLAQLDSAHKDAYDGLVPEGGDK